MKSKIGLFCDQVIEAGWLLALVIVPLFFNVYSSRVFEPDKLGLLRSIATIMLVCALISEIERVRPTDNEAPKAGQRLKSLLKIPLVVPTLLLAIVYLLTTATSVVPRVSFWGSYQRLQGTYTTLSYLVIFALLLRGLERREQLERLLTTVIVVSLPIAAYGLVQHSGQDPLPWGGDVTRRVAANMGNPIFVAAYLIMAVPITLASIIRMQGLALTEELGRLRKPLGLLYWALVPIQIAVYALLGFAWGIAVSLASVVLLTVIALYLRRPIARFVLLPMLGAVLSVQLVCIYFSQSRGPWLGLLAGLFFFGLIYFFTRRLRAAAMALIGLALLSGAFLGVINLPDSPLAGVRDLPYVGRLGRVFETESGTGKVRVLIWEGAVDLLRADLARTLIGYGPESMYVAYNKYYPPELAHYEARNASPDRSHNETFDALVMTGVVGFAVYMALFISIFYKGFEWLGLIGDPLHRRLFAVCTALGGLLGLLVPPLVDGSLRFIGVGVPVGLALALSAYVTVSAAVDLLGRRRTAQAPASPDAFWRALLLVALLSAVMAHFVEIHFGIAIAATRLYFWTYAALLAVIGREQVALAQPAVGPAAPTVALPAERDSRRARKQPRRKAKRAQAARSATAAQPSWRTSESICLVPLALVSALILVTQCWTFVTNPLASSSPFHILLTSFTTLAARREPDTVSLGLLWLLLITFGVGLVTSVAQIAADSEAEKPLRWWARNAGWFCLIAGGIGLLYGLVHASRLGPGADVSNLMVEYYLAIAAIGLALAATFYLSGPRPAKWAGSAAAIIYPALPVAAVLFISVANMRMVKADIIYKQGLRFDETGAWDNAIYIYRQAIDVAPNEDYYYLFYGRALLERAKQEASSEQRKALFAEALRTLREARDLNPLNTDHTANLARLYRNWAETESDPERRRDMLLESARYYKAATELSPNNAQLYNEWGLVQHLMGNTEEALAKYEQSLALDQQFAQTYMLLGDLYLSRKHYAQVVEAYSEALRLEPRLIQAWSALGYAYSQLGDIRQAISANLRVLEIAPDDYGTIKNLAVLHHQAGEYDAALPYAEKAAGMAPESEKQVLDGFVAQLKAILAEE